jgi:adenylate cyclase
VVSAVSTDLVIILSSDWVDSTATRTRIGEEPADALQEVHDTLLRKVIDAEGGRVIKHSGDGVLATFHSATAALTAAVGIQQHFTSFSGSLDAIAPMEVRVGLAAGEVKHLSGDIFGTPVVEAVRLQSAAAPGEILCSELVRVLGCGRGDFHFDDAGTLELKGLPAPVRAHRVRRRERIAATGRAPGRAPPAAPASGKTPGPSIAVLPFHNLSGDPAQEFFADGVVEAITATLSRIRSFFVIARNSAFRYKGKAVNVPEVGRELGVRYLLEGSVQKAADRVRITVQLIDAVSDTHIWADRVDGTLEDIFDLQDRITERVAGALQPSIRLAEIERARRKPPQELGAYDYTMRAMPFAWVLEKEASEKALHLLEQALAIDPEYPLALSLAGWCHAQQLVYNWTDDIDTARDAALRHAEKAAELSGGDPLILAVLGTVHTFLRNYGTARILLERAVSLDPNAAWAWSRLGWLENYSVHPDRALENFERAFRLSPLDPMNFNNYVGMAEAHQSAERYEEAVPLYRRALQERPHADWILRSLVASLVGAGRMEEAKVEFANLLRAYPNLTIAKFKRAMVFSPAVLDRMAAHLKAVGLPD